MITTLTPEQKGKTMRYYLVAHWTDEIGESTTIAGYPDFDDATSQAKYVRSLPHCLGAFVEVAQDANGIITERADNRQRLQFRAMARLLFGAEIEAMV